MDNKEVVKSFDFVPGFRESLEMAYGEPIIAKQMPNLSENRLWYGLILRNKNVGSLLADIDPNTNSIFELHYSGNFPGYEGYIGLRYNISKGRIDNYINIPFEIDSEKAKL
jgi:hypothetical protein